MMVTVSRYQKLATVPGKIMTWYLVLRLVREMCIRDRHISVGYTHYGNGVRQLQCPALHSSEIPFQNVVDEFTGRLMFGRRFSEGLHQAIEAKEGVKVERESQTLAKMCIRDRSAAAL